MANYDAEATGHASSLSLSRMWLKSMVVTNLKDLNTDLVDENSYKARVNMRCLCEKSGVAQKNIFKLVQSVNTRHEGVPQFHGPCWMPIEKA